MAKTTRMTVAQAIVKFLDNQYVSMDGVETKFVEGFFTIFGHGIAVGLGEALDSDPGQLRVMQGRNEQGMCHVATAFAKQNNRKSIIPCASSVGPGAANMVTACATATVNNIPLLVFPADTFASRQPDPVLQQLEQSSSLATTTNDAFKPVCKYWDRITRPEQLMTALINAMRVLTDSSETGACCIALPQDVEGESYDYPDYFFEKRVHRITRPVAVEEELEDIAEVIANAKRPLLIVGGGVKYSEAGETVEKFCEEFHIPFGESQAGKSACQTSNPYCLGGIGVTGTLASNVIAKDADVVIAVGSRLSDFTTSSKHLFRNEDVKFVTINNNRYHAYKMDAVKAIGDAKATVEALAEKLRAKGYVSSYNGEIEAAKEAWDKEWDRLAGIEYTGDDFEPIIKARDPRTVPEFVKLTNGKITQTAALAAINKTIDKDATIITAGGSLPSCMQRMWRTDKRGGYHAEYGYSCMGYEVAATLGVKFAEPDNEVYCVVGDSSFQMLHSEIMTIMQERKKVNILVFDNCGFGCINNLEMNHGIGSIATEFRYTDGKKPTGDLIPVDYAKIGEGYGLKTYTCKTIAELVDALEDAKKQDIACLFDLKVIPKTMTDGYESWWNVGIATTSDKDSVKRACEGVMTGRNESRAY
ncbi:MAG: 3D-(3,5/4)-trihydroxycyclohexane-1,2-dione acylhydrolase (decyclizing) [Blautia producta]|uniref:3D-(3,5/4)-trihydroxycyclohexane-1,2-dione acylhydrolase (decyclizing) n=1 Tax=Blautia producta TaxID=33035 RepID=UPI0029069EF1|nr:3D-(3,5/4)-trihydroxycyclohexane-1,2-dione acylhydrolase (decyclizing) [Blautia producta]MDU5380822.1 3D-(3,5/4)-trihydroxycyclohexane-1,2-dione acylhydrolase (decyclizing) [Blautia producta]MDU6882146.1 3D-(3,5/4)-trihydroxycyclohexane-1,2-dione acylhydrolase (decyclizing) [Blautia producta]